MLFPPLKTAEILSFYFSGMENMSVKEKSCELLLRRYCFTVAVNKQDLCYKDFKSVFIV